MVLLHDVVIGHDFRRRHRLAVKTVRRLYPGTAGTGASGA
jgi:hypothetical protein